MVLWQLILRRREILQGDENRFILDIIYPPTSVFKALPFTKYTNAMLSKSLTISYAMFSMLTLGQRRGARVYFDCNDVLDELSSATGYCCQAVQLDVAGTNVLKDCKEAFPTTESYSCSMPGAVKTACCAAQGGGEYICRDSHVHK
ncbi:MAG: hypothetical protein GOMPHAMPRED_004056 [Gomphillus americanus]|uniref:Uncharacterized protein n=1 Tax=Gomphillus americanus TaxID=1940652 RepID=A0A8H3FNG3_9LECA|nr:MAG: hypothetical protein GOMPHAMPRED_004056 [Gomphillus americanus]